MEYKFRRKYMRLFSKHKSHEGDFNYALAAFSEEQNLYPCCDLLPAQIIELCLQLQQSLVQVLTLSGFGQKKVHAGDVPRIL